MNTCLQLRNVYAEVNLNQFLEMDFISHKMKAALLIFDSVPFQMPYKLVEFIYFPLFTQPEKMGFIGCKDFGNSGRRGPVDRGIILFHKRPSLA